jgi:hypothetical protein
MIVKSIFAIVVVTVGGLGIGYACSFCIFLPPNDDRNPYGFYVPLNVSQSYSISSLFTADEILFKPYVLF